MELAQRVIEGDRRAAAQLITLIENQADGYEQAIQEIHAHTGRAHVIGITGPPGGGKSTLVRGLAREFRQRDRTVGIVAIDPTSPFSGGAVLGDRVRMQDLSTDPGVFIRSMASRGALGGLSRATADAVRVLDAFGYQVILVETVGAGQGEVDIARAAHTTIVVDVPGMGDEIQAIKAGILEIADVFSVNKADKVGADRLVQALAMMLAMNGKGDWVPPIVKTVATTGKGIPELADALEAHLAYLMDSGKLARRLQENALRELVEAAQQQFVAEVRARLGDEGIATLAKAITEHRMDPHTAARELVDEFRKG